MRIAVFASGSGSNFEAIVRACQAKTIAGEVVLCVCDQPNAFVLYRAQELSIPVISFIAKDFMDKAAYECFILEKCKAYEVEFIALAGYMKLIGPTLLQAFEGRMINLHPSLLPKYKGKDALGQAMAAGDLELGASIHYVNDQLDGGEVILQARFQRSLSETREDVEDRLHTIEHDLYIKALQLCCQEEV